METKTYDILASNQNNVEKQLQSLIKRAAKKGLSPIAWTWGEKFAIQLRKLKREFQGIACVTEDGQIVSYPDHCFDIRMIEKQKITVTIAPIKLNGWRFISRIEHLLDSDSQTYVNLLYTSPTETVDSTFQTCAPDCDHCHIKRYRKDTFIVRHDDGITKQVGSTCLADFLGIDATKFIAAADYVGDLEGIFKEESESSGGSSSDAFGINEVIRVAAAATASGGYISVAKAEVMQRCSTKDSVLNYLFSRKDQDEIIPPEQFAKSESLANKAIAFVESLRELDFATIDSDYIRNMAAIAKAGYCPRKAIGILASSVVACQRDEERKAKIDEAKQSTHQGTVGEKIGLTGETLRLTVVMTKHLDSDFGCKTLVKFVDANGNRYLWFQSGMSTYTVGETFDATGTVKKHDKDMYNGGAPITILTRVELDSETVAKQRAKANKPKRIKKTV